MNHGQMILWILEIIAFMAGLYAVQIPLRKKGFPAILMQDSCGLCGSCTACSACLHMGNSRSRERSFT